MRTTAKRSTVWIFQSWPGIFIAVTIPLIVADVTAFFLNRLANLPYRQIWIQWEFYVLLAIVILTTSATLVAQVQKRKGDDRRKATVGFVEIHETRNFTARDEELATIRAKMRGDPLAVVICGARGIGKSVLAREYAYRNREQFEFAWWVTAKNEDQIIDGLVRLGAVLNLDLAAVVDRRSVAERVMGTLVDLPKPVLLIFDDLENVVFLRWKPANGVRILATSVQAADTWPVDVPTISLRFWSPDESITYLRRESRPFQLGKDDAAEISRLVGGLPLALSHAGAYLRATVSATARTYFQHIAERLAEVPPNVDYPHAVYATIQESIARAELEARGSAAVLSLSAFFASHAIPYELLNQDPNAMSEEPGTVARELHEVLTTPSALEKALSTLHRLSLIESFDRAHVYNVHRLVQDVARAQPGGALLDWAKVAVAALDDVFPDVETSSWAKCERLLPHARAALAWMPDVVPFHPAGELSSLSGDYLRQRGAFREAEPLLRKALAIKEAILRPDSVEIGKALYLLADTLISTRHLDEAESLFRRAARTFEMSLGPSHPFVATVLNDIAYMLNMMGRVEEAEQLYLRALAADIENFGADHPTVARDLSHLAEILRDSDRLGDAEKYCRRALAINQAAYGPVHETVAESLLTLATVLRKSRRALEAAPLFRQALSIKEHLFGPTHVDIARFAYNFAELLLATGQLAEAETRYGQSLEIAERAYGPDHPFTAMVVDGLARVCQDTGRFREAESLFWRALRIDEASFEPPHPWVARDLHHLAVLLAQTYRFAEAEPLCRRAISIEEAIFGPEHSDLAIHLRVLAGILSNTNRPDEAETCNRRAAAIANRSM